MAHINIYSAEVAGGADITVTTEEHPTAGKLYKVKIDFTSETVVSIFAESLERLETLFEEARDAVLAKMLREETLSGQA